MSKRFPGMALALAALVASAAVLSAQQPRIINGRVSAQPAGSPFPQAFRGLVAAQSDVAWIGYAVPTSSRDRVMCSHDTGTTITTRVPSLPVKLEGPTHMMVLFRISDRKIERIRVFSEDCPLDAGGLQVLWLENVRPADSVALLEAMTASDVDRRVADGAVTALGLHGDPAADAALIRLARTHAAGQVRGNALFWLSQKAGDKAVGAIAESLDRDPDTEVKKRAVFALSQLPRDEGVPLLIKVARTHANAAVKRQAMFWLGQSKDPRAIEFFAEILK